ncbi:MAG TPA: hypothetical protein ENN24_07775 [Bacteroidetes bacterium]|mgnify:CR=1 FL=1|nr:hypothetical protein [Bacteroidota bacterium]
MKEVSDLLFQLGFNKLEAEVYLYLLVNKPATAYGIGKGINKPTANVYKAIESLAGKGAVMVEDNRSKVCKAVNPKEFLSLYEKKVLEKTSNAKLLLQYLRQTDEEERSYTISTVSLVFERFEQMMDSCKKIAVIDAFPFALERVRTVIEKATTRGVSVFVEAYQNITIKGADVSIAPVGDKALSHWQSQQLNLIVDGEEHLVALLNSDLSKVKQAVWSNNTYMSCMLHAGFMREQTLMKIMQETEKPNFESSVKKILSNQKFFYNSEIPGFNKLKSI